MATNDNRVFVSQNNNYFVLTVLIFYFTILTTSFSAAFLLLFNYLHFVNLLKNYFNFKAFKIAIAKPAASELCVDEGM